MNTIYLSKTFLQNTLCDVKHISDVFISWALLKFHTKFWTHTQQNVHFTVFIFRVWVTISLNCDVISLSHTGPWAVNMTRRLVNWVLDTLDLFAVINTSEFDFPIYVYECNSTDMLSANSVLHYFKCIRIALNNIRISKSTPRWLITHMWPFAI